MAYSDYGLDETKRSEDPGTAAGKLYCLWCHKSELRLGYYLCFVNWCICPDCVINGLTAFIDHQIHGFHPRIVLDHDFKANGKGEKELCYMDQNYVNKDAGMEFGISKNELLIAQKVLNNHLNRNQDGI